MGASAPGSLPHTSGQGCGYYLATKLITLPTYCVVGEVSEATEKSVIKQIVVPDVSDPTIAAKIGANVAPGLLNIDKADVQPLFYILAPKSPGQLPVIRDNPTVNSAWNTNFNYTPIMQLILLNSSLPPNTTVNTDDLIYLLLHNGALSVANSSTRLNAPVVGSQIN